MLTLNLTNAPSPNRIPPIPYFYDFFLFFSPPQPQMPFPYQYTHTLPIESHQSHIFMIFSCFFLLIFFTTNLNCLVLTHSLKLTNTLHASYVSTPTDIHIFPNFLNVFAATPTPSQCSRSVSAYYYYDYTQTSQDYLIPASYYFITLPTPFSTLIFEIIQRTILIFSPRDTSKLTDRFRLASRLYGLDLH